MILSVEIYLGDVTMTLGCKIIIIHYLVWTFYVHASDVTRDFLLNFVQVSCMAMSSVDLSPVHVM